MDYEEFTKLYSSVKQGKVKGLGGPGMFAKARAARAERKKVEDEERAKEAAGKKAQEVADNLPKWWSTPTKAEGGATDSDSPMDPTDPTDLTDSKSPTDPKASGPLGATPSADPAVGGLSLPRAPTPTDPGAGSGSGSVPPRPNQRQSPSPKDRKTSSSPKTGFFNRASFVRKQALDEAGSQKAAAADGHSTPDKPLAERRKSLQAELGKVQHRRRSSLSILTRRRSSVAEDAAAAAVAAAEAAEAERAKEEYGLGEDYATLVAESLAAQEALEVREAEVMAEAEEKERVARARWEAKVNEHRAQARKLEQSAALVSEPARAQGRKKALNARKERRQEKINRQAEAISNAEAQRREKRAQLEAMVNEHRMDAQKVRRAMY